MPARYAQLPTLGRLTGRGNTANVEVVLAAPDLLWGPPSDPSRPRVPSEDLPPPPPPPPPPLCQVRVLGEVELARRGYGSHALDAATRTTRSCARRVALLTRAAWRGSGRPTM